MDSLPKPSTEQSYPLPPEELTPEHFRLLGLLLTAQAQKPDLFDQSTQQRLESAAQAALDSPLLHRLPAQIRPTAPREHNISPRH